MSTLRQVEFKSPFTVDDNGVYPQYVKATEEGSVVSTAAFRNVNLTLVVQGGFEGTIKVAASSQSLPVDFSAASDINNSWSYINIIDLESNQPYAGNDGIVFTGAEDGTYQFAINTDLLTYAAVIASGVAAGSVDAFFTMASNV